MRFYRNIWEFIGIYVSILEFIGIYVNLWEFVGIYWKYVGIVGYKAEKYWKKGNFYVFFCIFVHFLLRNLLRNLYTFKRCFFDLYNTKFFDFEKIGPDFRLQGVQIGSPQLSINIMDFLRTKIFFYGSFNIMLNFVHFLLKL